MPPWVIDPDLVFSDIDDERLESQLAAAGFGDAASARRSLQRMAVTCGVRNVASCTLPAWRRVLPPLLAALCQTASSDRALLNLERFADAVCGAGGRDATPGGQAAEDLLGILDDDVRLRDMLVTLFAGSQFLTDILIRHPEHLAHLRDVRKLAVRKSADQFYRQALGHIRTATHHKRTMISDAAPANQIDEATWDGLRLFQRGELLRIGLCDLAGLLALPLVTAQLSNLADALVRVCLEHLASASNVPLEDFAIIAMGKLGGGELNYSSDIDLVFLAQKNAPTYERLGRRLIDAISHVTAEGFLYRVDMRLRPWGRAGPLVSAVGGYIAYLEKHARLWEKQALLKARAIAGNTAMGEDVLERIAPLLYQSSPDAVRADVHHSKQRIEDQLAEQGQEWGEVKLGKGSIRDVEFVAQYLQLAYGDVYPQIRSHNTLDALARLAAQRLITSEEYRVLVDGYTFLRPVEHYLQMMDYRQTHLLPGDNRELAYLARRLGFQGPEAGAQFLARYEQHSAAIRNVYRRHLMVEYEPTSSHEASKETGMPGSDPSAAVRRHLARMAPSYEATFSEAEVAYHARLAERLDEDNLVEVDAAQTDAAPGSRTAWRVTIVGYDYPGELSIICGLLFAYGLNIVNGNAFTYEPEHHVQPRGHIPREPWDGPYAAPAGPRKIVDVFNVHSVIFEAPADIWARYGVDLAALLRRLQTGQQAEAHGELAKRLAGALRALERAEAGNRPAALLQPVSIEIDNQLSDRYTVLHIEAADTIGFLYEFTSALALNDIYIARVHVDSVVVRGAREVRAQDTLYLTDARGRKISSPEKQRELRAATVLVKHFTHLLPQSPSPETALLHFREFLGHLFRQPDWPDQLSSLERPEVLGALARLLGVSDFLWEDFLRMQYANLFPVVRDVAALAKGKGCERLRAELRADLSAAENTTTPGESQREALNAFKDREMFRVDMRHIMGHTGLPAGTGGRPAAAPSPAVAFGEFAAELTDLAEAVIEGAHYICDAELRSRHGDPRLAPATGEEPDAAKAPRGNAAPASLAVCALGKCGGRELGFASDIELMFIFSGNGRTTGPEVITTAEYYEKLVIAVVGAIRAKREGIFQIDLQLRPYGRAGSMAVSLDSFRRYFGPGGAAWPYERQALIKMRPISGDPALGKEILVLRDRYVYSGEPYDVSALRAMRERQLRHLVTPEVVNAKYSPGGLVDIEYLVQALQINHGREHPELRLTNTEEAIRALGHAGILTGEETTRLSEAHSFTRRLIDALRMVRGNARDLHVPPVQSDEFAFLAQRLGYGQVPVPLAEDLALHTMQVQELSMRLLGEG